MKHTASIKLIIFIFHFSLFTFHFSLFTSACAQAEVKNAQHADSLYRLKDYQGAAAGYEAVISHRFASADLYYNLGNCYYRTGHLGLAILNYERALRLKPTFTDASQNLQLANSHISDRITLLPRLFVVEWYEGLVTHLSPSTWRLLVVILFAIACAAAVVIILSHRIPLRKTALALLIADGILLFLALLLLFASTARFNSRSQAIVIQPSIAVKSSPELQSVDKLILHEGTKVSISESLAGWHKITLADGTSGWCQQENIERI